jgi:hypothetical protein
MVGLSVGVDGGNGVRKWVRHNNHDNLSSPAPIEARVSSDEGRARVTLTFSQEATEETEKVPRDEGRVSRGGETRGSREREPQYQLSWFLTLCVRVLHGVKSLLLTFGISRLDFVMLQLRRLPGQLTRLLLQTLQKLFRGDVPVRMFLYSLF